MSKIMPVLKSLSIAWLGASAVYAQAADISHVGTTQVWDADGQSVKITKPANTRAGDLMVLVLHRTDSTLPFQVSGWTRRAECYKEDNGYQCLTVPDCTTVSGDYCTKFKDKYRGLDLAQVVFTRAAGASEPSSYSFNMTKQGYATHPGWAILTTLRGANTSSPVRAWANKGCDGDLDSLFPSVEGRKGDMLLLSQSFDDRVSKETFGAPIGMSTFGYIANSDESGFLYGGILTEDGPTGVRRTSGSGASDCKDALVSLTIKPKDATPEPIKVGPAGYTWCANEGGSCTLNSPSDVAYGADGKFNYRYGVTGTIAINNNTFGDPIPGAAKAGYYKPNSTQVVDTSAYYTIRAKHSGKLLEVAGVSSENGANVQQWGNWGGDNQQWKFENAGDGYYFIKAKHSGKVLDVSGKPNPGDGANVHQWAFHGETNQQWKLEIADDGHYYFKARHSGKVLDVSGFSTENSANVHQWSLHGGDNQKWKLEKVN